MKFFYSIVFFICIAFTAEAQKCKGMEFLVQDKTGRMLDGTVEIVFFTASRKDSTVKRAIIKEGKAWVTIDEPKKSLFKYTFFVGKQKQGPSTPRYLDCDASGIAYISYKFNLSTPPSLPPPSPPNDIDRKIAEMKAKNQKIKKALDIANAKIKVLEEMGKEVEELKRERESMQLQYNELAKNLDTYIEQNQILKDAAAVAEGKVNELTQRIESATKLIDNLLQIVSDSKCKITKLGMTAGGFHCYRMTSDQLEFSFSLFDEENKFTSPDSGCTISPIIKIEIEKFKSARRDKTLMKYNDNSSGNPTYLQLNKLEYPLRNHRVRFISLNTGDQKFERNADYEINLYMPGISGDKILESYSISNASEECFPVIEEKEENINGTPTDVKFIQNWYVKEEDSQNFRIELWDAGAVDGERVTVYLNGSPISGMQNVLLTKSKIGQTINLRKGDNRIVMIADDWGSYKKECSAKLQFSKNDWSKSLTLFNNRGGTQGIKINVQ